MDSQSHPMTTFETNHKPSQQRISDLSVEPPPSDQKTPLLPDIALVRLLKGKGNQGARDGLHTSMQVCSIREYKTKGGGVPGGRSRAGRRPRAGRGRISLPRDFQSVRDQKEGKLRHEQLTRLKRRLKAKIMEMGDARRRKSARP
ncbi:hypothetical protein AAMO2058_001003400 [Amorphochlora amoebiformis]|eukprot:1392226-Amorphochlora_amoeboformis.AAC.1